MARSAPRGYIPPKRMTVVGDLLDLTFRNTLEKYFRDLLAQASINGTRFFGDMATIKMAPLMNILASGFNIPSMVVKVIDCISQLVAGKKKYGPFVAQMFLPAMETVDPDKIFRY